jgi:hypothetical protein
MPTKHIGQYCINSNNIRNSMRIGKRAIRTSIANEVMNSMLSPEPVEAFSEIITKEEAKVISRLKKIERDSWKMLQQTTDMRGKVVYVLINSEKKKKEINKMAKNYGAVSIYYSLL